LSKWLLLLDSKERPALFDGCLHGRRWLTNNPGLKRGVSKGHRTRRPRRCLPNSALSHWGNPMKRRKLRLDPHPKLLAGVRLTLGQAVACPFQQLLFMFIMDMLDKLIISLMILTTATFDGALKDARPGDIRSHSIHYITREWIMFSE
jgi:hypothetical protein